MITPLHLVVPPPAVVSDYVPKALQVPTRVGVLATSTVMFLGLLKLTVMGPGIGGERVLPAYH